MNAAISFSILAAFFLLVVIILEVTHKKSADFTEYAVASRSFGSWFQAMSFVNTWLPGTVFIAFFGLAAGSGVIGYYVLPYSLLAVFLMLVIAKPVFRWGERFDLRTQADFVGMRYNSDAVRMVSALIGVVSLFPWLILAFQSVGVLFKYSGYGHLSSTAAVIAGAIILGIRQIWTVRMGVRGIVISDMVQGIAAYLGGGLIALGFIIWMLSIGEGFDRIPEEFAHLPGRGSEVGSLYYFSLVFTGAFGALCWPDMFVRLFTGSGVKVIQDSARHAAFIMIAFLIVLLTAAMLAHNYPGVADAPDNSWFILAGVGGPIVMGLASVALFGAAAGNTNALTASIGTHAAQDLIHLKTGGNEEITRTAKKVIVVATVLAVVGAILTIDWTSKLFLLAVVAYQGIVQLAPSLYLGIFWRRGTAAGALAGMIVGFIVAIAFQIIYPVSVPWLAGLTSGIVGLIINTIIYVALSILRPLKGAERIRVEELFESLRG